MFEDGLDKFKGKSTESVGNHNCGDSFLEYSVQNGCNPFAFPVDPNILDFRSWLLIFEVFGLAAEVILLVLG
jgi:hypothetical protein